MKKTLFLFILFSGLVFGQSSTEFALSKDGITDYVVVEVPENTKEDLYRKTIEWVNRTFDTPKEVIKGQIENDYIRIEGIKKGMFLLYFMGKQSSDDGRYQIEISFKDNKYKFAVIGIEQYIEPSQYNPVRGWKTIDFVKNNNFYFEKDGTLKKKYNGYQKIPDYFNSLNNSLKEYIINGKTDGSKKDDW